MPSVMKNGSLRRSKIADAERQDIVVALSQPDATVQSVARSFGRDESTIRAIQASYRPTDILAKAKLRASLNELVERMVDKADVDQIIDILSRPNVGILDPLPKGPVGGSSGPNILISVNPVSLAATNDEYALPAPQPALPEANVDGKAVIVGHVKYGESSVGNGD